MRILTVALSVVLVAMMLACGGRPRTAKVVDPNRPEILDTLQDHGMKAEDLLKTILETPGLNQSLSGRKIKIVGRAMFFTTKDTLQSILSFESRAPEDGKKHVAIGIVEDRDKARFRLLFSSPEDRKTIKIECVYDGLGKDKSDFSFTDPKLIDHE